MLLSGLDALRELTAASLFLRLTLAMLLGGTMGLERGRKRRAAGFRTYMLVCMGSALTGILSQYMLVMCRGAWAADAALVGRTVDVTRLGAKVYSGIGFLGAGTILVTGRREVKGLTTAAGLWVAACLGIALGAGFYECAVLAFLLIVFCMHVLPATEERIVENGRNMALFVAFDDPGDVKHIIRHVKAMDAQIIDLELDGGGRSASLMLRLAHRMPHADVVARMSVLPYVTAVRET